MSDYTTQFGLKFIPKSQEQADWLNQWFTVGPHDMKDDEVAHEIACREARAGLLSEMRDEINALGCSPDFFLDGIYGGAGWVAPVGLWFWSSHGGKPEDLAALVFMALTRFEDDRAVWFQWGHTGDTADEGTGGVFFVHRTSGVQRTDPYEWILAQLQKTQQLLSVLTPEGAY